MTQSDTLNKNSKNRKRKVLLDINHRHPGTTGDFKKFSNKKKNK